MNGAEALIATGMPFKGRATHPAYMYMLDAVWGVSSGIRRLVNSIEPIFA